MTRNKTLNFERTRLVQRLRKPFYSEGLLVDVLAFGGGLRNGGLSDEAMRLLRDVFRFDYMGAAEFEWGAIPEALTTIAKQQSDLVAEPMFFPLAEVAPDVRAKEQAAPEGDAVVYIICHRDHLPTVGDRIRGWAAEPYNPDLKESTRLSSALRPHKKWDTEICGWLELDNGFFFFTDREMWEHTARLFGVEA